MAYLAFSEPGMAGSARATAPFQAPAPAPAHDATLHLVGEVAEALTELERAVIDIARHDGLSTLRKPGWLARALGVAFGVRISPQLADPKLEAMRRIAVLSWRRGYAIASAEVRAFLGAGYSPAAYELVVDTIAGLREASMRAKRRGRGDRAAPSA